LFKRFNILRAVELWVFLSFSHLQSFYF